MFSVVIPLYNKELSIQNTIQSVLNQTCQDFEIVVINDGSTDNSAKAVENIKDDRIRLIHQPNQGVSAARNRGIKETKCEWIALLDGDDLWEKNHLEEIKNMMGLFPSEKVYVTSFKYSDSRKVFKYPRQTSVFKIENYFKEAIKENLLWTSIVVVNKSCIDDVGGFNIKLTHGEDLDLWARLAKQFTIIKSSQVTATYRLEAENRSPASFGTSKSRVFNYQFSSSSSNDEYFYYQYQIANTLRSYLKKMELKLFIKLYYLHFKDIPLLLILRGKK